MEQNCFKILRRKSIEHHKSKVSSCWPHDIRDGNRAGNLARRGSSIRVNVNGISFARESILDGGEIAASLARSHLNSANSSHDKRVTSRILNAAQRPFTSINAHHCGSSDLSAMIHALVKSAARRIAALERFHQIRLHWTHPKWEIHPRAVITRNANAETSRAFIPSAPLSLSLSLFLFVSLSHFFCVRLMIFTAFLWHYSRTFCR